MITPYVPLVLRENLEKVGKPRHKKMSGTNLCRHDLAESAKGQKCRLLTVGPTCRRHVGNFPCQAEQPAGTLKTTASTAVTLSVGGWPWSAITEDDDNDDGDDDAQDQTLDAGKGITQMIDDDSVQELPTSMLAAVKLTIEAYNQEKRAAAAVARSMVETTDKDHAPPLPPI